MVGHQLLPEIASAALNDRRHQDLLVQCGTFGASLVVDPDELLEEVQPVEVVAAEVVLQKLSQ